MTVTQPMASQQLPFMAMPGYGTPTGGYGYGMPSAVPIGSVLGQPVYVSSMSQIPVGAIPVSQGMLAQALGYGQAGAQMVQPEGPSTLSTLLKWGGIGAAAGAAIGAIPFLPLGIFSGAIVGAGIGAAIGLVKKRASKKPEGDFQTMTDAQTVAAAQAQMIASTPAGARSATVPAEARRAVVMSPEMRRTWALKVQAERAAAASAKP